MAASPDRRVIVLGIGIPLVLGLVVLAASVLGGSDTTSNAPTTTTSSVSRVPLDPAWEEALGEAFEPLREALPRYATAVHEWSTGERTADELLTTLDEVEPVIAGVAERARRLPDHRSDDLAGRLVVDAADLYVQAVAAHRAAVAALDEAVAEQWDRLGRRLRILGDRAFDRGRERVTPPVDPGEGVELRLPAEVPDFDRLELAVGPPLEPEEVDVGAAVPRLREAERTSQPQDDWKAAVEALDVPSAGDVEAAFGDADALADLARRLVAAAEDLRDEPVPDGDRGRADRVAVGWLVLADAARAAQLVTLSGAPSDVPAALVAIAGGEGLSDR
jgi:hypothetical protein